MAGKTRLCSWARHVTLTVPLSTKVYKWEAVNLNSGGNPAKDEHPIQGGGSRNTRRNFMVQKRDKLLPGGPLGSYADFNYYGSENIAGYAYQHFRSIIMQHGGHTPANTI